MIKRHHVLFPLILVFLTFILATAIGLFVSPRATRAPMEGGASPVTEAGYRKEAREVLAPVLASQDGSGAPSSADAVSQAYESLLALSVPTAYKEVHMGLVTSLYLLRDGLAGNEEARTTGAARFSALLQDNSWLK